MNKKKSTILLIFVLVLLLAIPTVASAKRGGDGGGRGDGPIIFVESQGLYFDSIITADPLPMQGNFQELIPTDDGLVTAYGPGNPGYLGGRWWVDVNGDGEQNEGDHFFMCPLLGPGRAEP